MWAARQAAARNVMMRDKTWLTLSGWRISFRDPANTSRLRMIFAARSAAIDHPHVPLQENVRARFHGAARDVRARPEGIIQLVCDAGDELPEGRQLFDCVNRVRSCSCSASSCARGVISRATRHVAEWFARFAEES